MQYITPLAPAYAEVFLLCMVCVILLLDLFLSDEQRGITYALPKDFTIGAFYTDTSGAHHTGYGSVAEGGVFPRNISKGTGTVFIQKTF